MDSHNEKSGGPPVDQFNSVTGYPPQAPGYYSQQQQHQGGDYQQPPPYPSHPGGDGHQQYPGQQPQGYAYTYQPSGVAQPPPPPQPTQYPQQNYGNNFQGNQGPPPQQQGGYPPQPPVVVPVIQPQLGHKSSVIRCPHCSAQVSTTTEYSVGSGTWLACLAIFGIGFLFTVILVIGCFLFFVCWVPCVVDECKDVTHSCPNCKKVIARKGPSYCR
ncbi:cell death-inducing p53-target protein 1 homolog [Symsagittifera roscoffensis]|uniref:cell death-inducing p53-target protein 1 homolog n=1 Tax=Symsagittifera roscoffensis TaxID=84072 RepID=UPI00307B439C